MLPGATPPLQPVQGKLMPVCRKLALPEFRVLTSSHLAMPSAMLLAEDGAHDVRVLRGGIPEWLSNDYPAESGPCRVCP